VRPSKVHQVNTFSMGTVPLPCKNYWNFVKMCPGSLLEMCQVGFVDTLYCRSSCCIGEFYASVTVLYGICHVFCAGLLYFSRFIVVGSAVNSLKRLVSGVTYYALSGILLCSACTLPYISQFCAEHSCILCHLGFCLYSSLFHCKLYVVVTWK